MTIKITLAIVVTLAGSLLYAEPPQTDKLEKL